MLKLPFLRLLAALAFAWPALAAAQPIVYLDKCADGAFMGLDLAIDYCERAIKSGGLSPRNTGTAHYYRSLWYVQQGRLQPAIADLDETVRLDVLGSVPDDQRAMTFLQRGFLHMRLGNTNAALADLDETVRLNPGYASGYLQRGYIWLGRRDAERALADFGEALKAAVRDKNMSGGAGSTYARRPRNFDRTENDSMAHAGRGQAYLLKNDADAAMAEFGEALRVNPASAPALKGRAALHERRGDFDGAIADYTVAARATPRDAAIYFGRARAWAAKGQFENAALDFGATLNLEPRALSGYVALWKHVAQARAAGADVEKKSAARQELARDSLRLSEASLYRQLVEFYLGRGGEESELLRGAGRNLAQNCQAHFFVAQHHFIAGNPPRGAQLLRAVAKQCPDLLQETWAARLELGRLAQ